MCVEWGRKGEWSKKKVENKAKKRKTKGGGEFMHISTLPQHFKLAMWDHWE